MSSPQGKPKFPPPLANPAATKVTGEIQRPEPRATDNHPPVADADDEPTDPNLASAAGQAPRVVPLKRKQATNPSLQNRPDPPPLDFPEEKTNPALGVPGGSEIPRPQAQIATPQQPASEKARIPAHLRMPDLGPINALMEDPDVTEIMVNDLRNVMVERAGKMVYSGLTIQTIEELNRTVRTILDTTGRILTPDNPYVDVALPDGSRVNIVAPPLTVAGPSITIRKFPKRYSADDLIQLGAFNQRMGYFLNACVVGRMNIIIAGGTGSGKTTIMNSLISLVPKGERLVTIEDTPELLLRHDNSVRMQTRPQTPTLPAITATHLVANALRMRPDRILVGECRKTEAMDMLQAMNTGHNGSMTTIHANTPRDALNRIETLCMMAETNLPLKAIRQQIANAIDLIVQVRRFRSGHRRIVSICEVTGIESEMITTQDIFSFEPDRNDPSGARGVFKTHGLVPLLIERLREQGIDIPNQYFA